MTTTATLPTLTQTQQIAMRVIRGCAKHYGGDGNRAVRKLQLFSGTCNLRTLRTLARLGLVTVEENANWPEETVITVTDLGAMWQDN